MNTPYLSRVKDEALQDSSREIGLIEVFTCSSPDIYQAVEECGYRMLGGVHATNAWPYVRTSGRSVVNDHMSKLKGIADLQMPSLGGQDHQFILASGKVQRNGTIGMNGSEKTQLSISFVKCTETGLAEMDMTTRYHDDKNTSIEKATEDAYRELFSIIRRESLKPLRIWNTMPNINKNADEQGDGQEEHYKQFNKGRRKAWLEYDSSLKTVCAATGIGNFDPEPAITISCLATPFDVVNIENPNQISFLEYSQKYGSPPSSRRGTLHFTPYETELYVAGTASIIGESNKFCGDSEPKDVSKQARRTLENIRTLISRNNLLNQIGGTNIDVSKIPAFDLENLTAICVYIRNPMDFEGIRNIVEQEYSFNSLEIMYLQADICRRPLDIEIEAIAK